VESIFHQPYLKYSIFPQSPILILPEKILIPEVILKIMTGFFGIWTRNTGSL